MRQALIVLAVAAMGGSCVEAVTAQDASPSTWVAAGTCTLRSPEVPQQAKFLLTIFSALDRENNRVFTPRLQITAADGNIPAAASLKGISLEILPASWTDLSGKVDIVDGFSMVTVAPKASPAEVLDPIRVARTLVLTLPDGGGQLTVDLAGSHAASEPLEACIAALPK